MEYDIKDDILELSNIENNEEKLLEIKDIIFNKKPKEIVFNLSKFENIDSSTVAAFLSIIKFNQDSKNESEIIYLNPPKTIEAKFSYVGLLDFGVVKRDSST